MESVYIVGCLHGNNHVNLKAFSTVKSAQDFYRSCLYELDCFKDYLDSDSKHRYRDIAEAYAQKTFKHLPASLASWLIGDYADHECFDVNVTVVTVPLENII